MVGRQFAASSAPHPDPVVPSLENGESPQANHLPILLRLSPFLGSQNSKCASAMKDSNYSYCCILFFVCESARCASTKSCPAALSEEPRGLPSVSLGPHARSAALKRIFERGCAGWRLLNVPRRTGNIRVLVGSQRVPAKPPVGSGGTRPRVSRTGDAGPRPPKSRSRLHPREVARHEAPARPTPRPGDSGSGDNSGGTA
jgi:hypothetical protein